MTENEVLSRYGLVPDLNDAPAIRDLIRQETANEGRDSNELLKTLCIQLFALGDANDCLLIWRAKRSSFDAGCYIDVQLMCGAGLAQTKAFLSAVEDPQAKDALQYICECEEAEDFEEFSPQKHLDFYRNYYGIA